MNGNDMAARNLTEGDVINITGDYKGQKRYAKRFVVVPYQLLEGNCAGCFPELNVSLSICGTAEKSNQPTGKYIVITVEKAGESRLPFRLPGKSVSLPRHWRPNSKGSNQCESFTGSEGLSSAASFCTTESII